MRVPPAARQSLTFHLLFPCGFFLILAGASTDGLAATFTVTATADSGAGSLRQAISEANTAANSGGPDVIEFNIPVNDPGHFYYLNDNSEFGVSESNLTATTESDDANLTNPDVQYSSSFYRIDLVTPLPPITDPVIVDGYTQPGATPNSGAIDEPLNTLLRIELDVDAAGSSINGLHLDTGSDGSTVRGLAIKNTRGTDNFPGVGLRVTSNMNLVEGVFLGPGVEGFARSLNTIGMYVTGATNTIGGTSPAQRNLISGNNRIGAVVDGSPGGNVIQGNIIGLKRDGVSGLGNFRDGLPLYNSPNNLIGGSDPNARNIVGNNAWNGIVVGFGAAHGNKIQGNYVGVDRTGTMKVENQFHGILLIQASDNLVGGNSPGEGNLSSGNTFAGVGLDTANGNTIQGNLCGTDATGNLAIGNGFSGVLLVNSSDNTIQENICAFNVRDGILISENSVNNRVSRNSTYSNTRFGIDLSPILGGFALGDGVTPNDAGDADTGTNNLQNFPVISSVDLSATLDLTYSVDSLNTNSAYPLTVEFFITDIDTEEGRTFIGMDTYMDGDGTKMISLNPSTTVSPGDGIVATVTDADGNTSEFSASVIVGGVATQRTFTVNSTGSAPDLNPADGACNTGNLVNGEPECTLCAAIAQANALANVDAETPDRIHFNIPANDPNHLYYLDDGIAGQVSAGSRSVTSQVSDAGIAGIDPDWPNSWYSILPESECPTITEAVLIDGLTQPGAMENTQGNGQGLNSVLRVEVNGQNTERMDDGFLRLTASGVVIRGLSINRMDGPQIQMEMAGGNRIEGCYLGSDISGTLRFPRPGGPITIIPRPSVRILSAENLVGGPAPAARNLLSGNDYDAAVEIGNITFLPGADNNRIESNLIGTDRSGMKSVTNRGAGIIVQNASNNSIGGVGLGNVISGNQGASVSDRGLIIRGSGGGNLVEENWFGFDSTGTAPLPNGGTGIEIESSNNTVRHNRVAHNQGTGISVSEGIGNNLIENSIHDNLSLGIDLAAGIDQELLGINLPQDISDADAGSNNLQNFPSFTQVSSDGSGILAEGILDSLPNTTFRIEFFISQGLDITGFGEGERFIGSTDVTADGSGRATFSVNLPAAPSGFDHITCTATSPTGDTSEFSGAFPLSGCGIVVTNTADSGPGSLRQALYCANSLAGVDTVTFSIPGAGPHVISPLTELPSVLDPVVIDGYSQAGSSPNTAPLGMPVDAVLQIQLDGTSLPNFTSGLILRAGGCTVRGLSITNHQDGFEGAGILVEETGNNILIGNFLGLAPDGTEGPNDLGIYLNRTPGDRIGGPDPADRNVISANERGIEIDGGGAGFASEGCLIQGNILGTAPDGIEPRPNLAAIFVSGNGIDILHNLIAHNFSSGIVLEGARPGNPPAEEVVILGNSIASNGGLGIDLNIDGVTPNDSGPPHDVDGGPNSFQNFPEFTSRVDTPTTVLQGSLRSEPNTGYRLEFFSNSTTDFSGFGEGETFLGFLDVTTDADGEAPFSFDAGMSVSDALSITSTATRKGEMGELLETSEFSLAAGGPPGCSPVVTNTDNSGPGSLREALLCANATPGFDTITFNIPGPGPHIFEVDIEELPEITEAVLIDGYTQPGSAMNNDPLGFNGNVVLGISGERLEPGSIGLTVGADGCRIRGLAIYGFKGVIDPQGESVFGGAGIFLADAGDSLVHGNILGLETDGLTANGNAFGFSSGFNASGGINVLGGTNPEDRNIVAGNDFSGVILQENNGHGNRVEGNFIGINRNGARAGNGENGVFINFDSNNFIGGPLPGAGNVIGDNGFAGIGLVGDSVLNNTIQGNFIGTDFTSSRNFGNHIEGILLFEAGAGNAIIGNAIAFNRDMGIDIDSDGPSENDVPPASTPPDLDGGSNNTQNFPVISSVVSSGQMTTVQGTLQSLPDSVFRIDYFANTVCDATGYGEGQFPLGFDTVTTNGAGLAEFESVLDNAASTGDFLTATATLLEGGTVPRETSEFSLCFEILSGVTPTPTQEAPCPVPYPDFVVDQFIDAKDLLELALDIREGSNLRDITGDSVTDGMDLLKFSLSWRSLECADQ